MAARSGIAVTTRTDRPARDLRDSDGRLRGTDVPAQLTDFDLPRIWQLTRGAGQRVAVIDTGVRRHPRLTDLVAGGDYVSTGDGTAGLRRTRHAGRRDHRCHSSSEERQVQRRGTRCHGDQHPPIERQILPGRQPVRGRRGCPNDGQSGPDRRRSRRLGDQYFVGGVCSGRDCTRRPRAGRGTRLRGRRQKRCRGGRGG